MDLFWLPLGAGGHSVRFNGLVFEAVAARLARRPASDLYHSALEVRVPDFAIEMTPVPDGHGQQRGVVESMLAIVRSTQRNVKRWHEGDMRKRWTAAGMLVAEQQFRRIIGYRDLAKLVIAVERHALTATPKTPDRQDIAEPVTV